MKISVVIPAYISDDLLNKFTVETIESTRSKKHQLEILVILNFAFDLKSVTEAIEGANFGEGVEKITIVKHFDRNGVAKSWNTGMVASFENDADYALVINNDIILQENAIDNLVDFAQEHPEAVMWTASQYENFRKIRSVSDKDFEDSFDGHPHFSCFMVSQKTLDEVGLFDENISPAYFEDGDYHYRILLSGNKALKTNKSKFYHYGSRTIKIDDELGRYNKKHYEANRAYIRKKWGVEFHDNAYSPPEKILEDGYQHPFNDKSKNWRDW